MKKQKPLDRLWENVPSEHKIFLRDGTTQTIVYKSVNPYGWKPETK
jgi:hypothetical protein